MKDNIMMIVCVVVVGIFGLLAGCQTTGNQTRDVSDDPYNVEDIEIEKG